MDLIMWTLLLTLGIAMLVKGADWFVSGASDLAGKLRVPPLIIGLTVVAMGTSIPEAAVSISAVLKGSVDITIGNVVGSNILNILIILGCSALIRPLSVKPVTIKYELPFLTGVSVLLLLLGLDGRIGRTDGVILLLLFGLYLGYLFLSVKKSHGDGARETVPRRTREGWKIVPLCLAGLAMTVAGSNIAVDAACEIAGRLGMSERLIGLTIVALGTSLPELVTSVTAARKGEADLATGNIVGSNIFNILFVAGTSALIQPVTFSKDFRFDSAAAAAAALLLILFCLRHRTLKRWHGMVMLLGYVLYFAAIV